MFQYFKFLADLIHVHILFFRGGRAFNIFSKLWVDRIRRDGRAPPVHSTPELLRTALNFAFAHSASNPVCVSYLEL